jgi:hypothetical protein
MPCLDAAMTEAEGMQVRHGRGQGGAKACDHRRRLGAEGG